MIGQKQWNYHIVVWPRNEQERYYSTQIRGALLGICAANGAEHNTPAPWENWPTYQDLAYCVWTAPHHAPRNFRGAPPSFINDLLNLDQQAKKATINYPQWRLLDAETRERQELPPHDTAEKVLRFIFAEPSPYGLRFLPKSPAPYQVHTIAGSQAATATAANALKILNDQQPFDTPKPTTVLTAHYEYER